MIVFRFFIQNNIFRFEQRECKQNINKDQTDNNVRVLQAFVIPKPPIRFDRVIADFTVGTWIYCFKRRC